MSHVEETQAATYRLVVIGESAVGKTSVTKAFTEGGSLSTVEATIGAAFHTKSLVVNGKRIKFDIWDTAGQERFHSLTPMYYRGADCAIIVYDITEAKTFAKARYWVTELVRHAEADIVVALSGNKADLGNRRQVQLTEGQQFADENGLIFMETSAKTSKNINELFLALVRSIEEKYDGASMHQYQENHIELRFPGPESADRRCRC